MKDSITVLIYTHNEQQNISECIDSALLLTDDVLLVDMESTDDTVEKARNKSIKVVTFPFSHYVEPARAFGIGQAKTDWIFILDADERITRELAEEIQEIIQTDDFTSYRVPRENIFGKKKWLEHGGWWPDFQTRLIRKPSFKTWPKRIHSTPEIEGEQGFLDNSLLHYFHGDLEKMVEKTTVFEGIESDLLFEAGREVKTSTFFRKFFGELYRRLIRSAGFLDGTVGIIESVYQAYSKTITYLYLYEKKNSSL